MTWIDLCSKENGITYNSNGANDYIRCGRIAVRWFWCPRTEFVSSSCRSCLQLFKDKLHWVRGSEVTRDELEVIMVMRS